MPNVLFRGQPESPEQAAQMIASRKQGAIELTGGGLAELQGSGLWPCMWPDPASEGKNVILAATAIASSELTLLGDAVQWSLLRLEPPYETSLARLTLPLVSSVPSIALAEVHWRSFLGRLVSRGLSGVGQGDFFGSLAQFAPDRDRIACPGLAAQLVRAHRPSTLSSL